MHSRLCTTNNLALRKSFQLFMQYVIKNIKKSVYDQNIACGIFIFTPAKSIWDS